MRLDAAPGLLRLQARGDNTSEAESELPTAVEGEAGYIVLDAPLLAKLLDAVRGAHMALAWAGPQAPVVVREARGPEPANLALVTLLHDPQISRQRAGARAA